MVTFFEWLLFLSCYFFWVVTFSEWLPFLKALLPFIKWLTFLDGLVTFFDWLRFVNASVVEKIKIILQKDLSNTKKSTYIVLYRKYPSIQTLYGFGMMEMKKINWSEWYIDTIYTGSHEITSINICQTDTICKRQDISHDVTHRHARWKVLHILL